MADCEQDQPCLGLNEVEYNTAKSRQRYGQTIKLQDMCIRILNSVEVEEE